MSDFQLGLQDSFDMALDTLHLQMFLTIKKSRSEESLFGKLQYKEPEQPEKKSLICLLNEKSERKLSDNHKRIAKKQKPDYNKNICGYITKKIIRQFISKTFREKVQQLCLKYNCGYAEAKAYYFKKIQRVTGPSHIPGLLKPENLEERGMKKAFSEFFEWFLKERYIRYLMLEGKMEKKSAYIRYKNKVLMQIYHAHTLDQQSFGGEKISTV